PPGRERSITELEYQKAREYKRPTLVFIKHDDEIKLPFSDAGTNEHPPDMIDSFRRRLTSGAADAPRGALFKSTEDLKSQVLKAYFRLSRPLGELTAAHLRESAAKRIEGPPYRGLLPFLQEHADRFFGRDAEIEALLERLLAKGQRFIAVIG